MPNDEDSSFEEQLYLKYKGLMSYIANKFISDSTLAEDLVSDSVVKILKNINTLKGYNCYQQGQYIVFIVKNTCIDHLKKIERQKIVYIEDEKFDSVAAGTNKNDPLDYAISSEGFEALVTIIMDLPDKLKDVAYHYFINEQNHNEIAEILGISYDNSKTRLMRARKLIKESLTKRTEGDKSERQ
jgi:RNA polymerase sigma-70 factor (ECF subfamily)